VFQPPSVVYISIVQIKVCLIDFKLPVHLPTATNHQRTILKTITMKLNSTTLFALFTSLPFTVAIQVLVPRQWMDTATIRGKNSSDGEIETMRRATSDPYSMEVCPAFGRAWDMGPDCEPIYHGVTSIMFEGPTKDPRPINVTMGPDLYQVSQTHRL